VLSVTYDNASGELKNVSFAPMPGVDNFESGLCLCLSTAEGVRSRLSDLFDGVIRIPCMSRVVVSTFTTLTIGRIAEVEVLTHNNP
jgi:hypothetical protein